MTLRFHPRAKVELFEAADYYAKRRQGLGGEFLDEAMRSARAAKEAPLTLRRRKHGVRYKALRRFAYALVYLVRGDDIINIAVAHWKRKPRYWSRRLSRA